MRSPWASVGSLVGVAAADQLRRSRRRRERRQCAERIRAEAVSRALAGVEVCQGPSVVVVMAALNEGVTIGSVLAGLPSQVGGMPLWSVVIDDGSSDDTACVAARAGAVVAVHRRNLGQGDGLRTGLVVARELGAEVVVTMDADGQHDPAEVFRLVDPILADEADYVQGSRFLGSYDDAGSIRHIAILGFTAVINVLLVGVKITDCTTGYRAIRSSGLARMRLVEDRFSTSEIIMEAAVRGLRMREVPVHIHRREVGLSKKPRGLGYPLGYLGAMSRSWIRARL